MLYNILYKIQEILLLLPFLNLCQNPNILQFIVNSTGNLPSSPQTIQNGPKGTSKMAAGGHFAKNFPTFSNFSLLFPTFCHFSPLFLTLPQFSVFFTTFPYFSPLFAPFATFSHIKPFNHINHLAT